MGYNMDYQSSAEIMDEIAELTPTFKNVSFKIEFVYEYVVRLAHMVCFLGFFSACMKDSESDRSCKNMKLIAGVFFLFESFWAS